MTHFRNLNNFLIIETKDFFLFFLLLPLPLPFLGTNCSSSNSLKKGFSDSKPLQQQFEKATIVFSSLETFAFFNSFSAFFSLPKLGEFNLQMQEENIDATSSITATHSYIYFPIISNISIHILSQFYFLSHPVKPKKNPIP